VRQPLGYWNAHLTTWCVVTPFLVTLVQAFVQCDAARHARRVHASRRRRARALTALSAWRDPRLRSSRGEGALPQVVTGHWSDTCVLSSIYLPALVCAVPPAPPVAGRDEMMFMLKEAERVNRAAFAAYDYGRPPIQDPHALVQSAPAAAADAPAHAEL
jgi:hypothetical protein